ncbi:MAG: hypothetical protein GY715_19545 [Planctomycetes bacterium]|nr:hypothetical protein [Planctomycetota bacterium]
MNLKKYRGVPFTGRSVLMTLAAAFVGSALVTTASAAAAAAATDTGRGLSFQAAVNAEFSVSASEVVNVAVDTTPGLTLHVNVPLGGKFETLHIWSHSARAPGYQVLVDLGGGRLEAADPQPVRTVRGRVVGDAGSIVSGSVLSTGLAATVWFADGSRWWIEPLTGRVHGAAAGDHVVYRNEDIVSPEKQCGNTNLAHFAAAGDPDRIVSQPEGPADGALHCTELACDADFEYFQDYNTVSAVETRINLVTNTMNPQYETETEITHAITTIIVRTSPSDPYTSTSSGTLLCEFITEWTNNQQGIDFDVAKLFTGKEISGGTIGQASNFGEICDRQGCCGCGSFGLDDGAFCYSQNDCCGGLGCSTDLMAHELGHLWDAVHCDPCSTTMRSFIGCFNTFTSATISDIVAHRNSRSCLDIGQPCGSPPEPTGACCISSSCAADTTVSDCDAAGGVFQGDGSTCSPNPCVSGSGGCCIECTCFETSPTNCASLGGTYAGNGSPCTTQFCAPCGACCFGDQSCNNVDTEQDCSAAGGAWQGMFSSCGSVTCPEVGTNDDCGFPTVAAATSSTALNNSVATPPRDDGGPGDPELPTGSPACQWDGTPTDVHNTLWVEFVATHGSVEIQTCNSTDVSDTIVALYSGTCGNLTELACGEDDCGPSGTPYRSRICYDGLAVGTTYLIMVGNPGGWSGSAPGGVTLDLLSPCPDITGACCQCDGSCSEGSEADCIASGGVFQGGASTCGGANCTVCTGACCLAAGSCLVATQSECDATGGTYQGDDTSCSPSPCPEPLGACCIGTACAADTLLGDCDAANGTFLGGGSVCTPGICNPPTGGCCVGCLCVDVTEADCTNAGGSYAGDDVPCSPAFCPPCTGACCFTDGSCVVQTADDCVAAGGAYQGDDVTCGAANCPPPACPEDLSDNGAVDFADILQVIAAFGPCPPQCPEDLDGSGDVGFGDILAVIGAWGPC